MHKGCQGENGRKCWEDVLWLVKAVTAESSHCTWSLGKHILCVDTGGAADFSTCWPGGVGRGRAKVFSQVWVLLAGKSRAVSKGTKSHTKGTLVTVAVPSCSVSMCTTPCPAQHPASIGAAPTTASNFSDSFRALRSSLHLLCILKLILSPVIFIKFF